MILETNEVDARLNSPHNLINQLRQKMEPSRIVSISEVVNDRPAQIASLPSLDELVPNAEDKINLSRALSGSTAVLADSVESLRMRLGEVESPAKLSRIASEMSRVIDSLKNKKDDSNSKQQVIIYKPVFHQESHYETIHVSE